MKPKDRRDRLKRNLQHYMNHRVGRTSCHLCHPIPKKEKVK